SLPTRRSSDLAQRVDADVGADGAQPVVVEELADLLRGDRADLALRVAGKLDLRVPDVGELLEHRPEPEARDLVADRVELDADLARGDQATVARGRERPRRGGGRGGAGRRRDGGTEAHGHGGRRERLDQAAARHLRLAHRLSFEGWDGAARASRTAVVQVGGDRRHAVLVATPTTGPRAALFVVRPRQGRTAP